MEAPQMCYRSLGRCGTKVSALGLGGWTTFGESITAAETTRAILHRAFDAGINFFDIADIYANGEAERLMGSALSAFPRHELVISSKVYFPMSDEVNDRGLSRKHIIESVEKSLVRVGTDYLDLYFCHRFDDETPIDETARAMDDLIHQGKVLYWGTSEWTGTQLDEVCELCDRRNLYPPQVEQPQYSLLARDKFENDVCPVAVRRGMGLVVWSPLCSGLLTGKYDDALPEGSRLQRIEWLRESVWTDEKLERIRRFKTIADDVGCSRTRLALAWAVQRPVVSSVILGATSAEQLEENLSALSLEITDDLNDKLSTLFPVQGKGYGE